MKIVILMEDTCGEPCCEAEHGLSVYVETKRHKILMDTGASEKTLENATEKEAAMVPLFNCKCGGTDFLCLYSHGPYHRVQPV